MQRTVEKAFFALIRFEIKGDELCDEIRNLITPEMLPALFKLSKKHDLAHLVGDALNKNGLLPDNFEAKKRFLQERNMAVYRYEQQQYEFEQICDTLEKEKIPFIPLKGSVIRQYYPEPWMRTSCDIDILVKEEELEDTARLLCNELGYTSNSQRTASELSLYSPSGVHLELHYDLTEGDKFKTEILSNIWQYIQPSKDEQYHLLLTDAAFYFYHIEHMVKHFENGGCGIRPFLDLWLLNDRIEFNKEEREALLKKGGFLKFATASEKLSSIWLNDMETDELSSRIEEYIFTGGVYGTMHNCVGMQQAKKGGKFKYLLSRVFISNKELKIKYPKAEKYPILIPFYHVVRWFKPLFKKESRERSRKELAEMQTVEEVEKQEQINLLTELGLK